MAVPPLGSGGRFKKLERELSAKAGIRNPAALAAASGMKKHGKARMAQMAAAGRKRKAKPKMHLGTALMMAAKK